jgi:hypothetical protein
VSLAYIVWPFALYERVASRSGASAWYQFHLRQALWFGGLFAVAGFVALVWPLLASFILTGILTTIVIYVAAMVLDLALFVLWFVLAVRYSRRAADGELFDIPWVARITGTSLRT